MVLTLGIQLWNRQADCRYEANLVLRDHEDVAMTVWKTLLHAQLPRDCQEKEPAAVMLMQRTRLSRDRYPRASNVYDTGYHTPGSLKSVHGCLSIPPGLGILDHLRIPVLWDPRKELQPFPGRVCSKGGRG